jgi:uncharacterized membrane protein
METKNEKVGLKEKEKGIDKSWLVDDLANIFLITSYFLKLISADVLVIILGLQLIVIYSALAFGKKVG